MLLQLDENAPASAIVAGSAWTVASRRIFSFPAMVAAALAVLAFLTVRERFNDPDLWWHLKTGEIIWNTHSIPQTDLFSFTTNNHAWTAHEWLSEVIFYGASKLGGYSGLMLLLSLLTASLLIATYALCSLYSGNAKVALLGALVVWLFGTVGMALRPHMIGYLLLISELLIIHVARSRDIRWSLLLPPLFALWINCHGSFILGLMVLGVVLFCSFFELQFGPILSPSWRHKDRNCMMLAFGLSIVALFLNPVGPQLVFYPFDVLFHQPGNLGAVSEWQPLAFNDERTIIFLLITGLFFFLTSIRRAELRLEELLLLVLGSGMAFRHVRMLFVFGILAAPVLARLLANAWDSYDSARDRRVPNVVMMLISLALIVFSFPTSALLEAQVKKNNPAKAVDFIRRSGLSGKLINEYVYGGYLIWALPEHKVFVDGRADVYEWTGVLGEFGSWAMLQADPTVLLNKYGVTLCLLSKAAPMAKVMPYLPGWNKVYSDESSVIFQRAGFIKEK